MALRILRLPEADQLNDLDDPSSVDLHAKIIRSKPFLRRLYTEWYRTIRDAIPKGRDRVVVELGSGGGFIKEIIPDALTSDVLEVPSLDMHFSALEMPFDRQSVDAVVMIDVLHHIPDIRRFFGELERCLKPGGKAVMIEPANTSWGRFIYQNFHHEPFRPQDGWKLADGGPMSMANGAIPWIVFHRDRERFEEEFADLELLTMQPHTPLRYLLSGGVSMRQLVPSWSFGLVSAMERVFEPTHWLTGMFYTIELRRRESSAGELKRAA